MNNHQPIWTWYILCAKIFCTKYEKLGIHSIYNGENIILLNKICITKHFFYCFLNFSGSMVELNQLNSIFSGECHPYLYNTCHSSTQIGTKSFSCMSNLYAMLETKLFHHWWRWPRHLFWTRGCTCHAKKTPTWNIPSWQTHGRWTTNLKITHYISSW